MMPFSVYRAVDVMPLYVYRVGVLHETIVHRWHFLNCTHQPGDILRANALQMAKSGPAAGYWPEADWLPTGTFEPCTDATLLLPGWRADTVEM